MEFFYRAITKDGEREQGHLIAPNERMARMRLLESHASILEISKSKRQAPKTRKFRVKQQSVVVFYRRLATLLSAGCPLAESLEFLGEAGTGDELPQTVDHLAALVQKGYSFSAALRDPQCRDAFDRASVGMIALGEKTGKLPRVIDKLADLKERQLALTRSFVSALTYPAVLFCCIIALGVLFTVILGPGDGGLFEAFGAEMPWPTKVVQSISSTVRNPFLMGGFFGIVGLFVWFFVHQMRTSRSFEQRIHGMALATPALGNLIRKIETARILYVLADAIQVGVPLLSAFSMSIGVCGNVKIKGQVRAVYQEFADGVDLVDALERYQLFDNLILSFIETGIESGNLGKILEDASKNLEEDIRLALEGISQLAEPLLLIFAGAMSGFLALATLMPIINMVETL